MEKRRALDIDQDCLELGELSVRIHNHSGKSSHHHYHYCHDDQTPSGAGGRGTDMKSRSSVLSWEQSSDASLGYSRETRARSEELRTKSREMIRSGDITIIIIIIIIRSGAQETMAAWSVTNRSE